MHRAFQIGIGLKAVNALLECLAGVALFIIPASWFAATAAALTQHELQEDPQDVIATHFIAWAQQLSPAATWYYAVYLLLHGAVKLGLVFALFKGWLWAYPLSLVVFGGFIVYQLYRFGLHPSWGLIALSVLDAIVMWLIWREYRDVNRRRRASP